MAQSLIDTYLDLGLSAWRNLPGTLQGIRLWDVDDAADFIDEWSLQHVYLGYLAEHQAEMTADQATRYAELVSLSQTHRDLEYELINGHPPDKASITAA